MTDFDLPAAIRQIAIYQGGRATAKLADLADHLAHAAAEAHAQRDAAVNTLAMRPGPPTDDQLAQFGITRRPIEATLVASRNQAYAEVDRLTGVLLAVVDALAGRHDYDPASNIHHRACGACAVLAMVPDDIRSETLAAAARRALPPIPGDSQ